MLGGKRLVLFRSPALSIFGRAWVPYDSLTVQHLPALIRNLALLEYSTIGMQVSLSHQGRRGGKVVDSQYVVIVQR